MTDPLRERVLLRGGRTVGTGVLVLLVTALVAYVSFAHRLPLSGDGGGRIVHADFTAVDQVNTQTPVRVNGVDVGHVASIHLDRRLGVTHVALRITDKSVRPRSDASAAIHWRTLLGLRMVVDLDPGSPLAPPLGTRTILESRTSDQTELDNITQIYGSAAAVAGQRGVLKAAGTALNGGPARDLINSLGPLLKPLPPAVDGLLGRRPDDLRTLVYNSAALMRTFAVNRRALSGLVTGAHNTFRTIANDHADLGATLDRAPATMDATVRVAHTIDATLPQLDLLVADLRPAARPLQPTALLLRRALVGLNRVLPVARPLLSELRPALRHLGAASTAGESALKSIAPTVARLDGDILPWLKRPDSNSHMPTYQMVGPTTADLAAASAEYDGISHVLHFPLSAGTLPASFVPCQTFISDPSATQLVRCRDLNSWITRLLGIGGRP